jgi:ketosteroid isomerase-like protein
MQKTTILNNEVYTMKIQKLLLISTLLISYSAWSHSNIDSKDGMMKNLDTAAAKVVISFHKALQTSDKKLARMHLANDVQIFEGGKVERSADQYAHHHMLSDMKYLGAMKSEILEHKVNVLGNTAISLSRTHITGTFKDKERDYQGMETMVLEKQHGEWKIIHIHWSN